MRCKAEARVKGFKPRTAAVAWASGLAVAVAGSAVAQAPNEAPPAAIAGDIGYLTVAAARTAVAADAEAVTTTMDEWVIIQQPGSNTQWTFTSPGQAAHPSAVKRSIASNAEGRRVVQMQIRCEASSAACAQLQREFTASSERLQQYLASREGARRPPGVAAPATPASGQP